MGTGVYSFAFNNCDPPQMGSCSVSMAQLADGVKFTLAAMRQKFVPARFYEIDVDAKLAVLLNIASRGSLHDSLSREGRDDSA
jgi:hypothetical protein